MSAKKVSIRTIFHILSSLSVFLGGAYLFIAHKDLFVSNLHLSKELIAVSFSAVLFTTVLIGVKYFITFLIIGIKLPIFESIPLGFVNRFLNQILTNLGEAFVAIHMKSTRKVLFLSYGGLFIITMLFSIAFNLILVVFIMCSYLNRFDLFILFVLILFIIAFLFIKMVRKIRTYKKLSKITPLFMALSAFFNVPTIILYLFIIDILYLIGMAVRYWAAFLLAGTALPFLNCLMMVPFANLTSMIGITPLGMGITEGVLSMLGKVLGYSIEQGFLAASLDRGIMICALLIFGPISYFVIEKHARKHQQD